MAKGTNIVLIVLCLFAGTGNSVGCIKQTYDSQIGVRELTGNNDGPEVQEYLKAANINQPVAWCGAFVKWVFNCCSISTTGNAWAPSWFPASRTIWKQGKGTAPNTGDVFGIYFQSKKRIAHVGFIDTWSTDHVVTVEGNTNAAGSREGDGVYRKRRLKSQIYAISRWVN